MDYLDDDGLDEVGFNFARMLRSMRAQRSRKRRHYVRRAAVLRPVSARNKVISTNQRDLPLGLGTVSVPAGGTAQLQTTVQRPTQLAKLILSAAAATIEDLTVTQIQIGVENQLSGTEGIPVTAFSQDSVIRTMYGSASQGTDVTVTIANANAGALSVSGAMFGPAAN